MSKTTRKKIIAGNWKMNKTRPEARQLVEAILAGTGGRQHLPVVILCPPFTSLADTIDAVRDTGIQVGAQNMHDKTAGAFTGEISAPMLTDIGVTHVIIGHSERRQLFGETNSSVNLKLKSALAHKLTPILCVGETLDERDANLTDSVVRRQVAAALHDIDKSATDHLIMAYEPVWAIGTGKVCEADEADRVCKLIRATISGFFQNQEANQSGSQRHNCGDNMPVLYGGSVTHENAPQLLAKPDIDGALVGGASIVAEKFLGIIDSAQRLVQLAPSPV